MPIYEYECLDCGDKFEDFRSFGERDREIKCPSCGSKNTKRVVSVFACGSSCNFHLPGGST